MQVTYKRLKTGLAEARYNNRIVVCSLADGRIFACETTAQGDRSSPLTSTDMSVWSYVANQLGDEFIDMVQPPTKMIQLIHNGIMFPSEPDLVVNMANSWARKLGTPYVDDPVFKKNFMEDFEEACEKSGKEQTFRSPILEDWFKLIRKEIDEDKTEKLEWSPEEKKADRDLRKANTLKNKNFYGYAFVNGIKVEVANYRAEPSSIFMGRGLHPKRGHWKSAVSPKDVVLNLSPDSPMPSGFQNRIWEPRKCYIAKWYDPFSEKWKYVWFGAGVAIRQSGDVEKFHKAENLAKNIDKVQNHIVKGLSSSDDYIRKVATATYLIATLGIRVGDEKDEDEADTVGATTLRKEHIKFGETKPPFQISLDFLGKDSVRYQSQTFVREQAYINLKEYSQNDLLFEGIASSDISSFLGSVLPKLTAKVFRTYIATNVVKRYLETTGMPDNAETYTKVFIAKLANLEAAKALNHRRTLPPSWEASLKKKEEKLSANYNEKLASEIALIKVSKDYSLSTSPTNYIDPRVFFDYCDKVGLPPEKLYSKTLLKKMAWALKRA